MPDTEVSKHYWVNVRLTSDDKAKLDRLCAHTRRQSSDLIRLLVRLAEPLDMPAVPIAFVPGSTRDVCVGEVER
jgi:hypothetical protein